VNSDAIHTSVDQVAALDQCAQLQFATTERRYQNCCTCVSSMMTDEHKADHQLDNTKAHSLLVLHLIDSQITHTRNHILQLITDKMVCVYVRPTGNIV